MVKVLYANKQTGTVVHDIYLSCREDEVKEYIQKFGTNEIEFPQKLVYELASQELDMLLYSLHSTNKKRKEFIDCFYIACNKIWEEVKLDQIDFSSVFLDEDYSTHKELRSERAANN